MFKAGVRLDKEIYGILGDDVVIFNTRVANIYLETCEGFGIPIGLAKSFISVVTGNQEAQELLDLLPNDDLPETISEETDFVPVPSAGASPVKRDPAMFNFANQTFVKGICMSVISLKEELACSNPYMRMMLAQRLIDRGWTDNSITWQIRLLFSPLAWKQAAEALKRGLMTHSMRSVLRYALSPHS
jgi:hypothetical protein